MNVMFWSEEDGCGTTSSMAAVASVCSHVWKQKIILMQGRNQEGDLYGKLDASRPVGLVREMGPFEKLDGLDYLIWQAKNRKLNEETVARCMIPVVKGRMYYLPQAAYRKPRVYPPALKEGMWQVIRQAEQLSDFAFVDCGSGPDELSEYLLERASAVVVNLSQERQNLDAYFQKRHAFRGRVIYLVNQYHQESIYNKKNLGRIYRIPAEQLGVIPNDPIFRHACSRGKLERFVRRQIGQAVSGSQAYFMQELIYAAGMILQAVAGSSKTGTK